MRHTATIGLLFFSFLCKAQVVLQPLLPQVGLIEKSQLWNIVAVNSSSSTLDCYISLSLQERQSGVEVMAASSANFTLSKGAKQLNLAALTPVQYNYFTGDNTNDFLTVGSYTACFKLMSGGEVPGELAEACVPFDVEPLSPPMLASPVDSSVLQIQPGQFTWQPPAPLSIFQELHYELVIAEILPGQTPEEALELNAPLYTDLNLQNNVMDYTGAYPSLEKGKWYAWQVVAEDGMNYAQKSEAWDFSIDSTQTPVIRPANGNYILLKSSNDKSAGINTLNGNVLGVKYYSFDKEHQGIVRFVAPNGKIIKEVTADIVYGNNFLGYVLDKTFKKGTVYSVQVTDEKNNKSTAFFIMK